MHELVLCVEGLRRKHRSFLLGISKVLQDLHYGVVNLIVVKLVAEEGMHEELIDSVLELAAKFLQHRVFHLQDFGHCLVFWASLNDLSDDVVKVD